MMFEKDKPENKSATTAHVLSELAVFKIFAQMHDPDCEACVNIYRVLQIFSYTLFRMTKNLHSE